MPLQLIVLVSRSGFVFSNSNYNYTNTNTNVSVHLYSLRSIGPGNTPKNHVSERSVGTDGKTIL